MKTRVFACLAAGLWMSGMCHADTVSIGVFSLFSPRSVVIQAKDAGRYQMVLRDTALHGWTGGAKSASIELRLRGSTLAVVENGKTAAQSQVQPGERVAVSKDEVAGAPFSFTLAAGTRRDSLRRNYRGGLSFLISSEKGQPAFIVPVVTEDIEQYCAEVAASELPPGTPQEALKAQVVVCRSYAVFYRGEKRHKGHDFCDTTHCQFWKGTDASQTGRRAQEAAEKTRGEVLTFSGRVAPGFFCGCCAGMTATPELIWAESPVPGAYTQVACPHSETAELASWVRRVSWSELCRRAKVDPSTVRPVSFEVGEASAAGGYVRTVLMDGKAIPAEKFRSLIAAGWGWNTIPGLSFTLRKEGDDLVIEGKGSGHGIGLCQAGAAVLARQKKTYIEILSHYFPEMRVEKGL